jgi:hypothetical protein
MIGYALKKIKEEWSGTFSGVFEEIFRVSATCGVSGYFSGFSKNLPFHRKNKSSNNKIITLTNVLDNLRFKRVPNTQSTHYKSSSHIVLHK